MSPMSLIFNISQPTSDKFVASAPRSVLCFWARTKKNAAATSKLLFAAEMLTEPFWATF